MSGSATHPNLPALEALPELRGTLAAHPLALLQAPPGAGKSTALPLELLHEPWLKGGKVLLLQPRRVAVRGVAARLAESLGECVGGTVGSRVRFETKVSASTRLEVITEGILTRRLQRDPELEGVGLVILDEFHERSLNADLALALLREVQGALRDDLRVLLMSATLDEALPTRLGAPLIRSEGRAFPVAAKYTADEPVGRIGDAVAAGVRRALREESGDVLAFLPGVREIRDARAALAGVDAEVLPLYGALSPAEQRRAVLPGPGGRRRVILATSIAETSLTIEGVRVVVDSGQRRFAAYDPSTGLSGLRTGRVTRAEAEQRAGRAGRVAPGVAYRLWPERTQALLADSRPPEILSADLAPLRLELAAWGVTERGGLEWLDTPPSPAWDAAGEVLRSLEALDAEGRVTPEGRELLRFPTHPRLAHLLSQTPDPALAADVAALLEERGPQAGPDLAGRVQGLRQARQKRRLEGWSAAERLSAQWRRLLGAEADNATPIPDAVGAAVALAYPERLALARCDDAGRGGRFLLAGGQGAAMHEADALAHADALAAAHLDGVAKGRRGPEARILLAAPVARAELERRASWQSRTEWAPRSGRLILQEELRLGALVLATRPLENPDPHAEAEAVARAVSREGLHLLGFSQSAETLRARVMSLRAWQPGEAWPDLSDTHLLETAGEWLTPFLGGVRSRGALARLDLLPALTALIPWDLQVKLDDLAPTHLSVPSGSRVRLAYSMDGSPPVLAVKLQEMFGQEDTPAVCGGRVKVLLHLLSPARRPVQVTQDLRSFWAHGYFEVRKDLRGRYPKHPWPDDPASHVATSKTKRALTRK